MCLSVKCYNDPCEGGNLAGCTNTLTVSCIVGLG